MCICTVRSYSCLKVGSIFKWPRVKLKLQVKPGITDTKYNYGKLCTLVLNIWKTMYISVKYIFFQKKAFTIG